MVCARYVFFHEFLPLSLSLPLFLYAFAILLFYFSSFSVVLFLSSFSNLSVWVSVYLFTSLRPLFLLPIPLSSLSSPLHFFILPSVGFCRSLSVPFSSPFTSLLPPVHSPLSHPSLYSFILNSVAFCRSLCLAYQFSFVLIPPFFVLIPLFSLPSPFYTEILPSVTFM